MTEYQFRRVSVDGECGEWTDLVTNPSGTVLVATTRTAAFEIRDKPQFKPGFYQMYSKAHTVRYFEVLAPGYPLDDFLRTWRSVDVVPRDQE